MELQRLRLLQCLKSVTCVLRPSADCDDYESGNAHLADWLGRYDGWFRENVGLTRGENLFVAYNRDVALLGTGLLTLPEPLRNVAKRATGLGYTVSISVGLTELMRNFCVVQNLCGDGLCSALAVTIDEQNVASAEGSLATTIDALIGLHRPVGLIGPVSLLRRHGILDLPTANGTDLTIYPFAGRRNEAGLPVPAHPVCHCAARLRLHIDTDGSIYPCSGLLGLPQYALGCIMDSAAESLLFSDPTLLQLEDLMTVGPVLQGDAAQLTRLTSQPWACEQHRMELVRDV